MNGNRSTAASQAQGVRVNKQSLQAWAEFRRLVGEQAGTVLEQEWLGVNAPHRCLCAAGHECNPYPSNVRRGIGICRTCAGQNPAVAEAEFRRRVGEQGGTVLEPRWLGSGKPHRCLCAAGHECSPRPGGVQQGGGICRICVRQDPATAEAEFRRRVAEQGGTVLELEWLGKDTPHRCLCAVGHECRPRPGGVQGGKGICLTCARHDPATAWAEFRRSVAEEHGGTVLEPAWLGNDKPHRCLCAAGHECSPRPTSVQQGKGICRICAYKVWDVFYVLTSPGLYRVKFGITSNDERERFRVHHRDGFDTRNPLRLFTGFPAARDLEIAVKTTLELAGERPVKGIEYYDISTLALVLDVADNYQPPRLGAGPADDRLPVRPGSHVARGEWQQGG